MQNHPTVSLQQPQQHCCQHTMCQQIQHNCQSTKAWPAWTDASLFLKRPESRTCMQSLLGPVGPAPAMFPVPCSPCLQASAEWTKLDMWEQSDVVLAFASKAADTVCRTPLQHGTAPAHKSEQLCTLLFDVAVARYLTATKLTQQASAHVCQVGRAALGALQLVYDTVLRKHFVHGGCLLLLTWPIVCLPVGSRN